MYSGTDHQPCLTHRDSDTFFCDEAGTIIGAWIAGVTHRRVMVGLIDEKSTEKLQQDITLLGLNEYAQMESTTAFQPDQTPSDPAPNPSNSTNVIVHNTQQPQRFATSEAQTPASSTSDHAAFFNYPSNIFQPQPAAATIYGASPYSASGYSDPSTPANGFPTPNLFSPMSYNAYAIPTPMDFNVIFSPWTINAAAMAAEVVWIF